MPQTTKSADTISHANQWSQQSGKIQANTHAPDGDSITATTPSSWVCYNQVDFGTGQLTLLMAYVAATAPDKTIQIRVDAPTGDLIGTLNVTPTGAADIFTEQYASITPVHGIHDIYLTFPDGAVSLDWFIFSTDPDDETDAQRDARMQWWREARFGTFIHWGPSLLGIGTRGMGNVL